MTESEIEKIKTKFAWAIKEGLLIVQPSGAIYLKLRPMTISIHTITFGRGNGSTRSVKEWVPEKAPPFVVEAYVPLSFNGFAYFKEVRVTNGNLPHASKERSCIYPFNPLGRQIFGMDISTPDAYEEFCRIVARHYSGINLGSLAVPYRGWRPEIKAFVPEKIKDLTRRYDVEYAAIQAPGDKTQEEIADETWTTSTEPRLYDGKDKLYER